MEQRRFSRFKFNATADLHIHRKDTVPKIQSEKVHVLDLSLKGVMLKADPSILEKIGLGDSVQLTIQLEENGPTIEMFVKLAHQTNDVAGFYCDQIDIDSITHLRRMVELNQGSSEILERDLAALQQE